MALLSHYSNSQSERGRVLKSKRIVPAMASGEYGLFRIPRYSLIMDIWVLVITAFDGTADAMTLGFQGNQETADPDGFMDAAQAALGTAGVKRATSDAQPWSEGKYFNNGSGVITASMTPGTSTAGEAYVFVSMYQVY